MIVVEGVVVVVAKVTEDVTEVLVAIRTNGVGYHATIAANWATLSKTAGCLVVEPNANDPTNKEEVQYMGTIFFPE